MKKICVVTSGRWDWGHLYWICKDIGASEKLKLNIICPDNHHDKNNILAEFIACGVHNIYDYGNFYIDVLKILEFSKPDIVLLLGDRYEIHAAATAATLLNIPIAHIAGGECTKGSFDDELRNSITLMSKWHFTEHEEYTKNVARMIGECYALRNYECYECESYSDNIYTVGAPGLDWLIRAKLKTKAELKDLPINLDKPFLLACFHSVTKELEHTEEYIKNLCMALDKANMQVLFIMPNIDPENDKIIEIVEQKCSEHDINVVQNNYYNIIKNDAWWFSWVNIEHLTYLSLMQYAGCMVGNSSSGIIEAASFNLPVINIGSRQKGRIKPTNIIDVGYSENEILGGIKWADKYHRDGHDCINPYGDGNASRRIVKILENLEV